MVGHFTMSMMPRKSSKASLTEMFTFIGGYEFRPFSNFTTKWLKDSEYSGYIWVIRIDVDLDGTEHCFPLKAHEAYGNKIA